MFELSAYLKIVIQRIITIVARVARDRSRKMRLEKVSLSSSDLMESDLSSLRQPPHRRVVQAR